MWTIGEACTWGAILLRVQRIYSLLAKKMLVKGNAGLQGLLFANMCVSFNAPMPQLQLSPMTQQSTTHQQAMANHHTSCYDANNKMRFRQLQSSERALERLGHTVSLPWVQFRKETSFLPYDWLYGRDPVSIPLIRRDLVELDDPNLWT